jgi:hypothetical protein
MDPRHFWLGYERGVAPCLPYRIRRALETSLLHRSRGSVELRSPGQHLGDTLTLAAIGDISLDSKYHPTGQPRPGPRLLSLLGDADLCVGNLEAQLTTSREPVNDHGARLRAQPDSIRILKLLQVDAVTCANNHVLDYGAAAVRESLSYLTDAGIAACGVGKDEVERRRPALLHARGISVAMLAYCDDWLAQPSEMEEIAPAGVSDEAIRTDIQAARTTADIVVVQLHWGYEFVIHPLLDHRDRARTYVDAGADLVLCHHAHVPMGFERHNRGVIAYGMGNFMFGHRAGSGHPWWNNGLVLLASLGREGTGDVRMVPVGARPDGVVELLDGPQVRMLVGGLSLASSRLADDEFLRRVQEDRISREGRFWVRRLIHAADQPARLAELRRSLLLPGGRQLRALLGTASDRRRRRHSAFLQEVAEAGSQEAAQALARRGKAALGLVDSLRLRDREPLGRLP